MAAFDPNAYETVDSRVHRFYSDHPDGRITTELVSAEGEVGKTRWIVKAHVWRDRSEGDPDGTGFAFEIDGVGMAQKAAALETCETSAVGRALANIGYSGDKRASLEEMQKAQRAEQVQRAQSLDTAVREWLAAFENAADLAALQAAWEGAGKAGVTTDPRIVQAKDARKAALA